MKILNIIKKLALTLFLFYSISANCQIVPVIISCSDTAEMYNCQQYGTSSPGNQVSPVGFLQVLGQYSVADFVRVFRHSSNGAGGFYVTNIDSPDVSGFETALMNYGFINAIFEEPILTDVGDPSEFTATGTSGSDYQSLLKKHYKDNTGITEAWDYTEGEASPVIAIIESGFPRNSPDLFPFPHPSANNQVVTVYKQNKSNSTSYSQINQFPAPNLGVSNSDDHVTYTAAMAVGLANNGRFGFGSAPNSKAIVVNLSGLSGTSNGTPVSGLYQFLKDVNDGLFPGIRVISHSQGLGGGNDFGVLNSLIENILGELRQKGIIYCAAAGNTAAQMGVTNTEDKIYPASLANVVSVSGLNADNNFEQGGQATFVYNTEIDICAPGRYIPAINRQYPDDNSLDEMSKTGGTSMSSPIVAGVFALMLSENPCLTPDQMEDIMKETATQINDDIPGKGWHNKLGAGAVNANNIMRYLNGLDIPSIVSGSEVWDNIHFVGKDVTISSGSQLDIIGKVHFAEGVNLIVEPGALLMIHPTAVLTAMCKEKKRWGGITLLGDALLPNGNGSPHGRIIMNGGLIEYAEVGVSIGDISILNSGGGRLSAFDATFLNNGLGIRMLPYVDHPTASLVVNCDFICDEVYEGSGFMNGIFVEKNNKRIIPLIGNKFENKLDVAALNLSIKYKGYGIHSIDSRIVVQPSDAGLYNTNVISPCNIPSMRVSQFINLEEGVKFDNLSNLEISNYILNNEFINVTQAIGFQNDFNTHIYGNFIEFNDNFSDGLIYSLKGVHSKNSCGYYIGENSFISTYNIIYVNEYNANPSYSSRVHPAGTPVFAHIEDPYIDNNVNSLLYGVKSLIYNNNFNHPFNFNSWLNLGPGSQLYTSNDWGIFKGVFLEDNVNAPNDNTRIHLNSFSGTFNNSIKTTNLNKIGFLDPFTMEEIPAMNDVTLVDNGLYSGLIQSGGIWSDIALDYSDINPTSIDYLLKAPIYYSQLTGPIRPLFPSLQSEIYCGPRNASSFNIGSGIKYGTPEHGNNDDDDDDDDNDDDNDNGGCNPCSRAEKFNDLDDYLLSNESVLSQIGIVNEGGKSIVGMKMETESTERFEQVRDRTYLSNIISVFPNPVDIQYFEVNISNDVLLDQSNLKFSLINSIGQVVYKSNVLDTHFEVSVSEFLPGLYTALLYSSEGGLIDAEKVVLLD